MLKPAATDQLNLTILMKLLYKWRKQLGYVFIGALVVSGIFTMPQIMHPVFKATTVVYPDNIQVVSKETQTEQLIQLMKSEDVWMRLVNELKLYEHYNIDTTGNYPRFAILKELTENLSIDKTEYESIEITAYDGNPVMAAAMCNTLLRLTDEKALNIIRERATEQIKIAGDIMNNKKAEIDSMENLMHEISTKYGITDFEYQVNGFSREYYHALGSGGVNAKMETDRKNFEEKGVEFVSLKEQLLNLRLAYVKYQEKYQFIEMDLHKKLSFHNTVSKAVPPQRKDSPKRTLIIFLFTISVLFFAVIYIIYTEYYKAKFVNEFKDVH